MQKTKHINLNLINYILSTNHEVRQTKKRKIPTESTINKNHINEEGKDNILCTKAAKGSRCEILNQSRAVAIVFR